MHSNLQNVVLKAISGLKHEDKREGGQNEGKRRRNEGQNEKSVLEFALQFKIHP